MNCRGRQSPENGRNESEARRATQLIGLCAALWALVCVLSSPSADADGSSCAALQATGTAQQSQLQKVISSDWITVRTGFRQRSR